MIYTQNHLGSQERNNGLQLVPRSTKSGPAFNVFTSSVGLILAATFPSFARGQQQSLPVPAVRPAPAPQAPSLPANMPDSVFHFTTELVQTDVIVLDRKGRFVDNLQREQFELRLDGTPQHISFFERAQAGPVARGGVAAPSSQGGATRGRTVLFSVDDSHLGQASLVEARRVLTNFIDSEMLQNDQVAISSTSGQIGFLQQLTSNPAVLRAAVARLHARARAPTDMERPPMTTRDAHIIEGGSDPDLLQFFVRETQSEYPGIGREAAQDLVTGRATQIVAQSTAITLNAVLSLERLVHSVAEFPGRKVVFFISDGFEINVSGSEISNRLRRIADAAARSRVVIYTMDMRGLTAGGGLSATQEPLYRLAADTGGRTLVNSNAFAAVVPRALQETSSYYLLAWTPQPEGQQKDRFHRIEVGVRGRPELTVRAARGYYDAPPPAERARASVSRRRGQAAAAATSAADTEILAALQSTTPVTMLPTSLSLGFIDIPNKGAVLTASAHLNAATLDFGPADGTPRQAVVDVVAAVLSDQGQGVSSFKQRLTVRTPVASAKKDTGSDRVTYRQQFPLKPGLYQVRVAVRDSTTGRVGSAMEWIEIPNLAGGPFSMSSLILGGHADTGQKETDVAAPASLMEINAGERFGRARRLRFLTYLYNAARSSAPDDVVLKVQVFRDDTLVIATPWSRLRTEGIADLSRIPYFAELNLQGMPSGRYVLQVTALDRTGHTHASQSMDFEIE